jgi:hypothetical protein
MTQEEIVERNKQIIELMGFKRGFWIHQEKPLTDDKKQWWDIDGKTILGTKVYYDTTLKFHSDWNWLMAASEFMFEIVSKNDEMEVWFAFTDHIPDLKKCFVIVSDFSKVHNKTNKTK